MIPVGQRVSGRPVAVHAQGVTLVTPDTDTRVAPGARPGIGWDARASQRRSL